MNESKAMLEVSDEDWQRAVDCAMSCLKPPFHISRSEFDNAMQHAFGLLSLRHSSAPQGDGRALEPTGLWQRRHIKNGEPWSSWYIADDKPTPENMKFDGVFSYEYRPLYALSAPPSVALEAAIAAAAPQPIETAPKDGSHILAWRIPIGIRVTNNTNPPTVVHWFDDPDEPGFYTSVNERAPEHPFNPTHWTHLPPSPALTRPQPGGAVAGTERGAP